MTSDINRLHEIIPELNSSLVIQFVEFFELVERYNSKINLVAKSTISKSGVKHFADSYYGIQIFKDFISPEIPLFDFGSGNGFPGIIAALMFPEQKVILVERDQRKAEFLKIAGSKLKLDNVEVHAGPLSDLSEGSCQLAMSRAMAPLPKFLLEARSVMAPGSNAFMFKGTNWTTELGSCPPQVFDYWEVELLQSYLIEQDDDAKKFIIRCRRLDS